jgi:ethanolaminephosphotransferase
VLWQLIITTYSDVFVHMLWSSFRRIGQLGGIFALTMALAAFSFKLSYTAYDAREMVPLWLLPMANAIAEAPLVSQAQAVFAMVTIGLLYTYFFETTAGPVPPAGLAAAYPFSNFTDIFLLMQTRFVNVPLILIFRSITRFLSYLPILTGSELTVTTLIFQHVSFFALGGANAISSVDLSNAYNGVSGYNIVVVGLLTFVSNWVGPIFWATAAPTLLSRNLPGDNRRWERHLWAMTTFYAAAGVAVMAACTALRTHLFIWTVFSPKYLYTMVWSTVFHVVVGIGWGSVMMWASGRTIV